MEQDYRSGSLTLAGTVAMGTGVMIGAGIFALTGQVAEFAGPLFPLAFVLAALISALSAYTYIKVSGKYPSAGGIAMILEKAYGPVTVTGGAALLMAFSMVINESLVARTFATYTLQLFDAEGMDWLVPALSIGLIVAAFLVNIAGNEVIGTLSKVAAVAKVGGILVFAAIALWASGFEYAATGSGGDDGAIGTAGGFLAGTALAILAYKGFTTITNSGSEVIDPKRNVGRAIMISLGICLLLYLLVSLAVGSSLTVEEISAARDYSLAEAARPALGNAGVWFTVVLAIVATASGVIASIFAVSRMLAMLTDMELVPHRHFGMPGRIQSHTLVYTVVLAGLLAALFDLGRIASLGAVFYLVMDIIIHWGVLRRLREDIGANPAVLVAAIALDLLALGAFMTLKAMQDPWIIVIAVGGVAATFLLEWLYLSRWRKHDPGPGPLPDEARSQAGRSDEPD
ncbi:MAG: APC family permease [Pseudomonadota bacterium]|nr:APC family permease [Pseudomonadota bacterium]